MEFLLIRFGALPKGMAGTMAVAVSIPGLVLVKMPKGH
jgi:hypothetical protein